MIRSSFVYFDLPVILRLGDSNLSIMRLGGPLGNTPLRDLAVKEKLQCRCLLSSVIPSALRDVGAIFG